MNHKDVGRALNATEWKSPDTHRFTAQAAGDMVVVNASRVMVRLPVGTEGQLLGVVGGVPTWRTE